MAIVHPLVIAGSGVVYIDAREDHLTPDRARRLAIKLLEAAQRAEEVSA